MARTKTEPTPSALDVPLLPSDVAATSAPPIDDDTSPTITNDAMPTELVDPATEPRSEAHTTPETTPPSLIGRLKAKADQDRHEAETAFTKLVERLARDEGTEAEVADILKSSGKTIAELETAVDHAKRIIKLKSVAADLDDAVADQRKAQTVFRELKESQKQQFKQMENEFKAARSALHTAERRSSRAQTAANDLARICPPPVVPPQPEPVHTFEIPHRPYNQSVTA